MSSQTQPDTENRPTAEAIRIRMNRVREEIGEDVDDVVESSKSLTDWKAYVRANPLAFALGGLAIGYLLVPRKIEYVKPDTSELVKAIKKERLVVAPKAKVSGRSSLTGSLLGMVAATATRAAISSLMAGAVAKQAMDDSLPTNAQPTNNANTP